VEVFDYFQEPAHFMNGFEDPHIAVWGNVEYFHEFEVKCNLRETKDR
jgi:hypothetical protein